MTDQIDVRTTNLTKRYKDVVALDGVDLDIHRGEFLSLLGPSGCGKSTMLRLIAGLVQPTAGDVYLHGESMRGVPPNKRGVGIVFQNYALFPHMTVSDNVAFGLEMRKVRRAEIRDRVGRALELVRLEGFGDRFPYQLSGGQQQRVALARALVFEPTVLLLDESLGALDKQLRLEMERELKALQRSLNVTTIFVTHDQEEALTMSDRIAVMNAGGIEQLGSPREIYERPTTKYVLEFIGATNQFRGNIKPSERESILVSIDDSIEITGQAVPVDDPNVSNLAAELNVLVAVRPENIQLASEPPHPNCPNVFEVQVEDISYIGNIVHYYLVFPNNQVIRAERPNMVGDQIQNTVQPRDRLYAYWSPESTLLFRDDSG